MNQLTLNIPQVDEEATKAKAEQLSLTSAR